MRNVHNAIKRVAEFKGPLSKAIVCYTAKQTLNQVSRRWIEAPVDVDILEVLETPLVGRKLDAALTKAGIEWLRRYLFKIDGTRRYTKALEYTHDGVFEIVGTFTHFTFDGFGETGWNEFVPRWRVHGKAGSFVYSFTGGRFGNKDGNEFDVSHVRMDLRGVA